MISLLCCGCLRLMAEDGKTLLGEKAEFAGAVSLPLLIASMSALKEQARTFKDKDEADAFAISAGWTVRDEDGTPNHRCPECGPRQVQRSGAYIEWPVPKDDKPSED